MRKRPYEKNYVQILNETARAVEEKNNPNPISLEALGLLVNLWSYDVTSWDLHKTELYKRYAKNKKTSVGSAWDELVEAKYIHEFKFRNGRKWEYIYYYRPEPFSKSEIQEIEAEIVEEYRLSSTSDFQQLKFNTPNSTVQNTHIRNKEHTQEKLKKEKPKKKDSSLAEIEITPNIVNDDDEKEPFEINFYAFQEFKKDFEDNFPNTFDERYYSRIIEIMTEKKIDFITYPEAVEQLRYMAEQREKGLLIGDSAKYFVGGIELKRTSRHVAMNKAKIKKAEIELKARKEKQEEEWEANKESRVPFYNWLEQ